MHSKESMGSVGENYAAVGARMLEIATARGIEKGIEVGVKAAIDYISEEREKTRKSRYDRRLHNTRLLLKNYRQFKKHAEGAIYNARQVKESAIDILDGLDDAMLDNGNYVEGIKKSQQRTIIILHHIEEMLRFYKISCEQSGKPEEMRRYRTIMAMYIDDEKKTAQQIAEKENVEDRTVYKDITAAIKPISALIFGIDSLKVE
ncbi:MAG: hypothetical protein LUD19_03550 [Clostridia bacterium]|nr:hypothetical protein [Clostridia bacterium]